MFYRKTSKGILVYIYLTPRAAHTTIDGVAQTADGKEHLMVRVRALPEKGKSNCALITLLAKEFAVPARSITLIRGATSRFKHVLFTSALEDLALRLSQQKTR